MHLATGCQDGLLRIYDVCKPSESPLELKVSATPAAGVSKIAWSLVEPDVVFVGKKSGVVEKWDTRVNSTTAPVASVTIPGGENIMDFEQSTNHNILMVASGKKVHYIRICSCTTSTSTTSPLSHYHMLTIVPPQNFSL